VFTNSAATDRDGVTRWAEQVGNEVIARL